MKLSIIIPIYNAKQYLNETIHSVLAQNYADFELLLIDDGSTDGSAALCDEFALVDSRIKVIHQENAGVSAARNAGVSSVQGEFIGFVDSDDLIEPDMYSVMMEIADSTGADIVQCCHDRKDAVEGKNHNCMAERIISGEQFVKEIFTCRGGAYTNQVALWSKIYRRKLFDGIVFPVGRTYEDEQETYKLCLKAEKIALVSEVLYHYVKRENSIITGVSPRKMLDKQAALRDRLHYLPDRLPELTPQCCQSYYGFSINILIQLSAAKEAAAYNTAKKTLLDEEACIRSNLDKYGRLYLRWLRHSMLERLLIKYEFEPIQAVIRRLRGLSNG